MAGLLPGDPSHHGMYEGRSYKLSQDKPEEGGGRWYFSRKEIEENSPSRRDGIDLKKETYLRKSYCTFLQDLGMRLKVPQVTIATAIIFCHRFFLRQSHAKNDRRTIATVCMFLAGKVEETPRPLKDVILVSYEIIHKKDPAAVQRIKQKEVYEQQKELILIGERVVLATLGFDLNVHHPYKPLVEAIKKFKVAQNALAQVAWNFVNDGLRTSLCLQCKPHHIAAGAIFLAAKFLKVKLPSDGEKVWWQEFDVTPRQLEEVSNQMLELYEQNRVPPSQTSEVEGSGGGGVTPRAHHPGQATPVGNEEEEHAAAANNNNSSSISQGGGGAATSKPCGTFKPASSRDNHGGGGGPPRNRNNDYGSIEPYEKKGVGEINDENQECDEQESLLSHQGNTGADGHILKEEDDERKPKESAAAVGEVMMVDKYHGRNVEHKDGSIGQSPQDAVIKKIDKDKVKAALEKRKKSRGDITRKRDLMDEDDLIERELEDGIELAADSEKTKRERKQNWSSKASNRLPDHHHHHHHMKKNHHHDEETAGDGHRQGIKKQQQSSHGQVFENVEEGEVASFDDKDDDGGDADRGYRSPKNSNSRKRKAAGGGSPPDKAMEGKQHDYNSIPASHYHHNYNNTHHDDRNRVVGRAAGGGGYPERDHKRHIQEGHV